MAKAQLPTPAQLTRATQAALERNALDEAEHYSRILLAHAPADVNGLLLSGIIAYRRQRYADALALLSQATEQAPGAAIAWFWRGNVERARSRHAEAIHCYRRALELSPQHAQSFYNNGLSLQELGEIAAAGPNFVQAGRLNPHDPESAQRVVDCAAALARGKYAMPPRPMPIPTSTVSQKNPLLSFIVCSITPSKLHTLRKNIAACVGAHPWELVHIADASSLCEGYTRGTAIALGDVLVFCHDDIEILDTHFHLRLMQALTDADVVGVAGTTKVTGPAVAWTGQPHVYGWITHLDPHYGFLASISSLAPARVDHVQALDGLFIATYRHVVETVGFDAAIFDGFHFYDLDFSYRAFCTGLRLRIQADLLLSHASSGNFDTVYWHYARCFCEKFPQFSNSHPPKTPGFFQVPLTNRAEVTRFYAWIAHWLG